MPVDLSAVGKKLGSVTHTYTERDVILYALGVGAGVDELQFTYERDLNVPPDRPPDRSIALKTRPDQALLYRLSGDMNPLHADPDFAKLANYDRPILHGLCTFGYAGRAVLQAFCRNDPARLKAFEVRFSGVVFPGETIITDMWQIAPGKIVLTAKTERGEAVLSSSAAEVVA